MIPFGPWRPDAAGINTPVMTVARNVLPSVRGFLPVKAPASASAALADTCRGAVTVRLPDGTVKSYAGTSSKLYRLASDVTWADISGGATFAVASGDRWRFEIFGDNLIATNFTDNPQKVDVTGSGNASDLGGTPPKARYVAVVRDFAVLACLENEERKLQWSAINDAEGWTVGTNSSDEQEFPSGGPITGIIGGETGYIWQADKITRMSFLPGDAAIFQFDEVEAGRGCTAPNSLVRLGNAAYYYGTDGFYKFDLGGGASQQLGTGKWARWIQSDIRAGTELEILGGISPTNRAIIWAYISRENPGTVPDRILVYDWVLDEATTINTDVEAVAEWLSQGYTLDNINSFGDLDSLPYGLDSPFWRGGRGLVGLFNSSHVLTHFEGSNMEAFLQSSDAFRGHRVVVQGTRPHVDAADVRVSISAREGDGDSVSYETEEQRETTGEVPAYISGNYIRARFTVPAGQTWERFNGVETMFAQRGKR